MHTLECLAQFRQQVYQTFTQRPAALLELIDAVAQTPRPHSPAELSLTMQRHWTSLYDALRHGCMTATACAVANECRRNFTTPSTITRPPTSMGAFSQWPAPMGLAATGDPALVEHVGAIAR